ncbi:MAG TPA: acyltransferase [Acidobacteriaceae bacterium]|nr:acyltransferase [Acidobacteriaceae bacterium]
MQPRSKHTIPSLDGLRAISILLVVCSHASLAFGAVARARPLGQLGVQVFFVISGYLITTLLLREWERTGGLDLTGFYVRRTTRILPAYLAFLGVLAVAASIGWIALPPNARWWPALTFTSNIASTNTWFTGHSWSLSVEEQFYVSWPIAFAFLGPRRARWLALAVFLGGSPVRALVFAATHHGLQAVTLNHDFIAVGCVLALAEKELRISPRWQALMRSRWMWLMPATALALQLALSGRMQWQLTAYVLAVLPILAVAIAVTVAWCVEQSGGRVGRILNSRPMRAVGVLSYSIYLWQEPFLAPKHLGSLPVCLIAIAACASLSYYFVERPGLAFRRVIGASLLPRWHEDESPAVGLAD